MEDRTRKDLRRKLPWDLARPKPCVDDYVTDKSIWLIKESIRQYEAKQATTVQAPTPKRLLK